MLRVQWARGNVSHVSGGSREVGGAWRERRVKRYAGGCCNSSMGVQDLEEYRRRWECSVMSGVCGFLYSAKHV